MQASFNSFLLLISALLPAPLHFELKGVPGADVQFASDQTDWQLPVPMTETSAGVYSLDLVQPWALSRDLMYKFIVNGKWIADPANPKGVPDGWGGRNSVRKVPAFQEDPLLADLPPNIPACNKSNLQLVDREGAPRTIEVLSNCGELPIPPGVKKRRVTVYFQDGGDYLTKTGVAALLARLSARPDMPALTGVFVPPKDRMREYALLDTYASFVAKDLVTAVEAQFLTGGSREDRVLIGPSMGGLITVYTALQFSSVFGHAVSQSGSLWWNEGSMIPLIAAYQGAPLNLFMTIGLYESPQMLQFNRQARDAALKTSKLSVHYQETPSTHDWLAWRNTMGAALTALLSDSDPLRRF